MQLHACHHKLHSVNRLRKLLLIKLELHNECRARACDTAGNVGDCIRGSDATQRWRGARALTEARTFVD